MVIAEPVNSKVPVNGALTGKRYVFRFDQLAEVQQRATTWDQVKALLGGKGAGLADMTKAGVPVPPGFTVTTEACNAYMNSGGTFPEGLWEQVLEALRVVEVKAGKKFASQENPLLVSVRSGAKFSMPGMMDTVLNLGMNDATVDVIAAESGDPRFAYDAYRRLVQMFGTVVMNIPDEAYEDVLTEAKQKAGVKLDVELTAKDWQEVVKTFKSVYAEHVGSSFPQDPYDQLRAAIDAVFRSWNGKRAIDYRNATNIPHDLGTAVNVQMMVFGNLGPTSSPGVAFTRNPSTGDKVLFARLERLEHRQSCGKGDLFHRRRREFEIAAFGTVGLGNDGDDLKRRFTEQCRKTLAGQFRRAHEDNSQGHGERAAIF